jgi:ketosteroid isomerase-like protein
MSSDDDAEIVRSMLDTWDREGLDAARDSFDPDVELVDLQSAMGMKDRGRGPDELGRMAEQWTEIFDDWRMEVHGIVGVGDGLVLAEVSFHGVGRDSGIPISNRQFEGYRLVEGKIVEIRVGFRDREQALEWLRAGSRAGMSTEALLTTRRRPPAE